MRYFTVVLALVCGHAAADPAIIQKFKDAGLEAESPTKMGPKNYGMAPFVCKGTRFLIPSLGEDAGGRLFVCKNKNEANAIAGFYNSLGRTSAALFSWVYQKQTVVLQINGELDEEVAERYREAL
jgi:hypothetical protein